jgi:hypothetical protein
MEHLCSPAPPDACPLHIIETYERFDLAEARAERLAESVARTDHDRYLRGLEDSGTRALMVEHDVWLIEPSRPTPIVLAVPARIPRQRALVEALRIIGSG